MKEAVGSTLLLNIVIVFLFVYVMFLAVAINYAKAFSVKNQIINIIEQSEGCDGTSGAYGCSGLAGDKIALFLNDIGYNQKEPKVEEFITARGPYYRVTTYIEIKMDLPILNWIPIVIPIKGETRIIYEKGWFKWI